MTSKERVQAVIDGREPDRVPVCLHNFLMAADEAGIPIERYRSEPAAIADLLEWCFASYAAPAFDGQVWTTDLVKDGEGWKNLVNGVIATMNQPQPYPVRPALFCIGEGEAVFRDFTYRPLPLDYPGAAFWADARKGGGE